jgi:serine protease inhibitor ecotin
MRFVPPKAIEQQDLQALHRIRSRLIGNRTQLGNQIRGLLAEYGSELLNRPGHGEDDRNDIRRRDKDHAQARMWHARDVLHQNQGGGHMCDVLRGLAVGAMLASPNAMRTIISSALLMIASIPLTFAADDMKAFPPAEQGMIRHVIRLPKQKDETAFKIELIIGKTIRTDAKNGNFFGGTLETENIPGWGFNRYILRKLGPLAGTLMAVDPDAPQQSPPSSCTSLPLSKSATAAGVLNRSRSPHRTGGDRAVPIARLSCPSRDPLG